MIEKDRMGWKLLIILGKGHKMAENGPKRPKNCWTGLEIAYMLKGKAGKSWTSLKMDKIPRLACSSKQQTRKMLIPLHDQIFFNTKFFSEALKLRQIKFASLP